jgi:hypothetical protein
MKPEQHDRITRHANRQRPLQQGLSVLKALFVDSWFALGNVLLLIGGDDSVEIGFESLASLTLNQTTIPFSGNDIEGDRV